MISSAVVIPETIIDRDQPQSPSLKRKFSPLPERDSKRPRIDTETALNGSQIKTTEPSSAVSVPSQTSPQSRRRSQALGLEEKKRNQRLFGTLLGTLSQATAATKPAHRKRDEIEARQRERLKRQNEEQEKERSRQREQTQDKRLRDQQLWDEEGLILRHRNMRVMAGYLLTKVEPRLYYLPWELRDEEQDAIKRQKEDVELQIQKELNPRQRDNDATASHPEDEYDEMDQDDRDTIGMNDQSIEALAPRERDTQQDFSREGEQQQTAKSTTVQNDGSSSPGGEHEDGTAEATRPEEHGDRHKEDDHHGEELVEGQEDDVIY